MTVWTKNGCCSYLADKQNAVNAAGKKILDVKAAQAATMLFPSYGKTGNASEWSKLHAALAVLSRLIIRVDCNSLVVKQAVFDCTCIP